MNQGLVGYFFATWCLGSVFSPFCSVNLVVSREYVGKEDGTLNLTEID